MSMTPEAAVMALECERIAYTIVEQLKHAKPSEQAALSAELEAWRNMLADLERRATKGAP